MTRLAIALSAAAAAVIISAAPRALATDCFIDSANGNDSASGLTEDQAVQTQAKIPSSCTVAKYKRGSVFNEAVKVNSKITTYTNYGSPCDPLPKFTRPRTPNNGSMLNLLMASGITIDGLSLSGSMSDASMSNLLNGVCVVLGSNSKLLNSEITNSDIGIMLLGTGNLVRGNYVHDLYISVDAAPGVDPNNVGGAEGIFINGSNNEVSYNSFIRCSSTAEWTGGNCDGGATEVSVGAGKTMTGVKVHHNFSYKSCGFFEASSIAGSAGNGTLADSSFYDNVSIDSGWLMLLQVNNTNFSNFRWENNTVVQHKSASVNPGMLVTVFTGTSSGVSGGDLAKDSVYLLNDLFILDGFGAQDYVSPLHQNLVLQNTLTLRSPDQSAGVVNVAGTKPADFELVAGSPAIDSGTSTANNLDFLDRAVPSGAATDVGAFEYGASLASDQATPVTADIAVSGCTTPTAGSNGVGGSITTAAGGATGTGGAGTQTTGSGGSSSGASNGGTLASAGGSNNSAGGRASNDSTKGGTTSSPLNGGAPSTGAGVSASGGTPGANGGSVAGTTTPMQFKNESGCSCGVAGRASRSTTWGGLALLLAGSSLRRRVARRA